ncbi:MAG: hypothetical protein Q9208_007568 [Pyrenodesmia sp. 3 TL-2023]
MPPDSFSPRDLTIAWAARVSLPQLGARLMAFIETRASITVFRLAVQNAPSTVFGNLPEELIAMIARNVRDMAFERRMKKWVKISNCLTDNCNALSHVHSDEISDINNHEGYNLSEDELQEAFSDEYTERHRHKVAKWYRNLTTMDGRSEIGKCARILAQEHGIRPYFMMNPLYGAEGYDYIDNPFDARAYLILPVTQAPVSSARGDETAIFAVNGILDPSMMAALRDDQRQKFQTTAAMLSLHPYNVEEDESMYEEPIEIPEPEHAPRPCGACTPWLEQNECPFMPENGLAHKGTTAANSESIFAKEEPVGSSPTARCTQSVPKPKRSKAKELLPQLMILGCGELEASVFC